MAIMQINPTRMELTRVKKQLSISLRGHKLLKDKQDEMIRQFMLIIKETKKLREEIDKELLIINRQYQKARIKISNEAIDEALLVPTKSSNFKTSSKNIMNLSVPIIEYEENKEIDLTYSLSFTPIELDEAIIGLSQLQSRLVKLAELEKSCDILADEIEKTRRRVNAIEYIMIPNLKDTVKYISQKLDDAERSNIIRLMKSKEIILAKQLKNQ
ncbi:MAG: V-type ATP synthase subunit D [Bacilli bacterium]|jgi:V/A-type H+-transporting ATPase subunit D|nr:V-type ATP synthase subunit D [Bacilli bacterium]MDD4063105.1 V-type ATP synthase subunit D [Bacilli bacterium]MDD4481615.1 V-type ATP synthase subunit D [Bacilli bacterium]MDY0363193.1 V-type ATP synthase subunit D [Bacilli bacterium]